MLPGRLRMLRVRNTSRTRPLPLCMWNVLPSAGHDARGVLAAMLQHQQPVVEQLVDRVFRDDAKMPHITVSTRS